MAESKPIRPRTNARPTTSGVAMTNISAHDSGLPPTDAQQVSLLKDRLDRILLTAFDTHFEAEIIDGQIVHWAFADSCYPITGYRSEEFEQRPNLWEAIAVGGDQSLQQEQLKRACRAERPSPVEYRIARRDGEIRWIRVVLVPSFDLEGGLTKIDGLVAEITAYRNRLDSLSAACHELENQLQQRTAELTASKAALERELLERVPADSDLASDTLTDEKSTSEDARLQRARAIRQRLKPAADDSAIVISQRTGTVHESMANRTASDRTAPAFGRVAESAPPLGPEISTQGQATPEVAGQLQFEAASISTMLEQFIGQKKGIATEKRLDLRYLSQRLPLIDLDVERMKFVLDTLLTNAIVHTPSGGRVGVAGIVQNDGIQVTVWDSGVGIEPEKVAHIWEVQPGSSGKGPHSLVLCRRIIEAHGGQIWVDSELDLGSRFTFTLPRTRPEHLGRLGTGVGSPLGMEQSGHTAVVQDDMADATIHEASPLAGDSGSGRSGIDPAGKRVLVIEDQLYNRVLFRELLTQVGIEVIESLTAEAGLRAAEASPPDLVVIDLRLPDGSGIDVVRELRANEKTRTVPIVAVTAYSSIVTRDACLAAGCDGYFSKPIQASSFIQQLVRFLKVSHEPGQGTA